MCLFGKKWFEGMLVYIHVSFCHSILALISNGCNISLSVKAGDYGDSRIAN